MADSLSIELSVTQNSLLLDFLLYLLHFHLCLPSFLISFLCSVAAVRVSFLSNVHPLNLLSYSFTVIIHIPPLFLSSNSLPPPLPTRLFLFLFQHMTSCFPPPILSPISSSFPLPLTSWLPPLTHPPPPLP